MVITGIAVSIKIRDPVGHRLQHLRPVQAVECIIIIIIIIIKHCIDHNVIACCSVFARVDSICQSSVDTRRPPEHIEDSGFMPGILRQCVVLRCCRLQLHGQFVLGAS